MAVKITIAGATDRQLEQVFQACGLPCVSVPATGLTTLAHPSTPQPDVVVVDLRGQTIVPTALSALKRQHPSTSVVIVASAYEPALLVEAMRAGVNEIITDPLDRQEVEGAITRVVGRRATVAVGQVFGFIGAKGGVGTTTVAVNVAATLARSNSRRALLIDLHMTGGDAALFLGVEPTFSVTDALENTHRLDESFFGGLTVKAGPGLDLLASSERPTAAPIDRPHIRTVLEFAARAYHYTVVDLPRSDVAVLDALDPLAMIVIVANQELATVRNAARLATTLRHRYGRERVSVVVSRSDRFSEIDARDIEKVIGARVVHTFPSDYRVALDAMNRGRPMVGESQTELATALSRFARQLAGLPEPRSDDRPSGLLGRLTGRRA